MQNLLKNTVDSLQKERQFLSDECVQLNKKLLKSLETIKMLQSGSDKRNASTIREQALSAEVSRQIHAVWPRKCSKHIPIRIKE